MDYSAHAVIPTGWTLISQHRLGRTLQGFFSFRPTTAPVAQTRQATMGDWDVSCAICGVIFIPEDVYIESEAEHFSEGKSREVATWK